MSLHVQHEKQEANFIHVDKLYIVEADSCFNKLFFLYFASKHFRLEQYVMKNALVIFFIKW